MVGRPLQRLLVLEDEPTHAAQQVHVKRPNQQQQQQQQPDAGTVIRHSSTPNACYAAPKRAAPEPASESGAAATAINDAAGDGARKRLVSFAERTDAEKFLALTRNASGACVAAAPPAADADSSADTSEACCALRYPSATSSDGGRQGIVVNGESAMENKLMAMSPAERRLWRQQQEKRPVASRDAWARYAEQLRAGEEVELGRARILMEDGRPSNMVVLVSVRWGGRVGAEGVVVGQEITIR